MKKFLLIFNVFLLIFGMVSNASALLITPSTPGYGGTGTSMNDIRTYIGSDELYMSAFGDSDTGLLAVSYTTTFGNLDSDGEPQDATISYVGGNIVGPIAYLSVKDGEEGDPSWYVFNLTELGWTGTEEIEIRGFWEGEGIQGAISNVALFGTSTPVPEPATMLLLGTGLVGLAATGRKKLKKTFLIDSSELIY